MKYLIKFKKDWHVEWSDRKSNTVKLLFGKGEVIACNLDPDGPGSEEFEDKYGRCCEVFIPGGIDLWNVPMSYFDILVGDTSKFD
jgi:hypothetical protein